MLLIADDGDDLEGSVNEVQDEEGDQKRYGLLRIEIGIGDDENQKQHDLHPENREKPLGELAHVQMAGRYQRAMKDRIHPIEDQGQKGKKQVEIARIKKPEHQKT